MSTHLCLKSAKCKMFRSRLSCLGHKAGPSPVLSCESFKYPQGTRMYVLSSSEIASQGKEHHSVWKSPVLWVKVSSLFIFTQILDHIWNELKFSSPWSPFSNLSLGVLGYIPCQRLCWGLGKRFGYIVYMPPESTYLCEGECGGLLKGQRPRLCLPFLHLPLFPNVCHGNKIFLADGFGWCLFFLNRVY